MFYGSYTQRPGQARPRNAQVLKLVILPRLPQGGRWTRPSPYPPRRPSSGTTSGRYGDGVVDIRGLTSWDPIHGDGTGGSVLDRLDPSAYPRSGVVYSVRSIERPAAQTKGEWHRMSVATGFTILSPIAERRGHSVPDSLDTNAVPAPTAKLRVALLSNSKANVDNLFRGLAEGLREKHIDSIAIFDKGSSTIPAPVQLRDEIVASSDLVITAMAD